MNKDKKIIGVTRKVDKLGRVSIPKSYREELGIKEEGEVRIVMVDNQVIIEKKQGVAKMRVVGWILKIYCNLVETGETKGNWENFKTFQDKVLEEINKGGEK